METRTASLLAYTLVRHINVLLHGLSSASSYTAAEPTATTATTSKEGPRRQQQGTSDQQGPAAAGISSSRDKPARTAAGNDPRRPATRRPHIVPACCCVHRRLHSRCNRNYKETRHTASNTTGQGRNRRMCHKCTRLVIKPEATALWPQHGPSGNLGDDLLLLINDDLTQDD